ncbi:hypothetical protein DMB92_07085 [Campylobacter sp. MIT 99-7217]|uniref:group I intron-associated PD-(D/E)XK endonuclease n=1 Tax=Campylobacter sp. MIT 99-7217 TaxID=535091 RepID=UPI00115A71BB|nr:group I intron-associated PD-(D/E)XK endonuclease [Campylobacter sp. MIT 99-7217]TQR30979.1 hypothetical protein DMB92_07085 [Campylobacter sp. MIT 99-7217]
MNIEQFVKQNIRKINERVNDFKNELFNSTEIKEYLKQRFVSLCDDLNFKDRILKKFKEGNYQKKEIIEIANNEILYKNDIELFLETQIFLKLSQEELLKELKNLSLEHIKTKFTNDKEFKFIQNKLAKILEKALFIASKDGFSRNLNNINSGTMTANAGDSAQFLFIARAILAGFNASNVDVRSSRYDAIVDFENTLLRIQVKGISSGELISFKDRDRGGQGIYHKHERNQGKRITKKDCDLYMAVDKQVGICYLIPMSFADKFNDKECTKIKLSQLKVYKENWEVIKKVAQELKNINFKNSKNL